MGNFPGPFLSTQMLKYKEKKKPEAREQGLVFLGKGHRAPSPPAMESGGVL